MEKDMDLPNIKGLILDMDGVLWREKAPIIDMPTTFAAIQQRNLKVVLATNNSTKSPAAYQSLIRSFGVELEEWQILTSSLAVADLLHRRFPEGGPVYIIGESGLEEALLKRGFILSAQNPVAVVAGIDRQISFEKLKIATLLIRSGVPFYGTNPDRTFPTPEGLIPGAGSILAALETATDQSPIIAGKPHTALLEVSLERLGTRPEETLMVGDRLETDILGGQKAGCKTALVLSGVSTYAQAIQMQPPPDFITETLQTLVQI
jgi:4-nitrophenyl phosphatase